MLTCSKVFADIPFGHRQHIHDGHCAYIHGHNWSIKVTFAAKELDENGFIIDFGKLGFLKKWIKDNLDHACLFNVSDTKAREMVERYPDMFKARFLDDVSAEGLAQFLHKEFDALVQQETDGRVWVQEVTLYEDGKNSATYRND